MKKILVFSLLLAMVLILVACAGSSRGTYYPDSSEMKSNLENKNYTVSVEITEDSGSTVTVLKAVKDYEYIEFYWLSDDNDVDEIKARLKDKFNSYDRLVSLKNDDKFGNVVFCSTEKARDDAGIVIINVKVDVKN